MKPTDIAALLQEVRPLIAHTYDSEYEEILRERIDKAVATLSVEPTHFAFLIKRQKDAKAWATIFTDRRRADEYPDRASAVVPLRLGEQGDA